MQISKLIALFIFINFGIAQNIDSTLYLKLIEKGNWGDYFLVDKSNSYTLIKSKALVDSIIFFPPNDLSPSVLNKLFKPLIGSYNKNQTLKTFQLITDAYPFINNASSINIARYSNSIAILADIKTQFRSQIGGILGSSRNINGEWLLTGEIDASFENIGSKAFSANLMWKQPDEKSRLVRYSFGSPFLFMLPFGFYASFYQDFFENSYINQSVLLKVTLIGPFGLWSFGKKSEKNTFLANSEYYNSELISLGLKGDRRNNRWLPFSGSLWQLDLGIGKINYENTYLSLLEGSFHLETYRKIGSRVLLLKIQGEGSDYDSKLMRYSRSIKFGGANSIRGYYENQFLANWVIIQSTELISRDFSTSQLFLFLDTPFSNIKNIGFSYGLGIRQKNKSLHYEISLGFPSNRNETGKIHIKFGSIF